MNTKLIRGDRPPAGRHFLSHSRAFGGMELTYNSNIDKTLGRLVSAVLAGYFLYFAIPALNSQWATDDPMNIGFYWMRGFPGNLWDNLRFWTTAYRPMGSLFYMPIYYFSNLNPMPYRVAMMVILAVNLYLSYRVAEMLAGSKPVAALTTFFVCAHAGMLAIYYNTSQLYDVLTYLFLMIMMFSYIRFRRGGKGLTLGRSAIVICAYIAALNSKEIAFTGAGWVLVYEVLYHRPWKLRVPAMLMAIAVIYSAGKFLGPNPLWKQGGYLLEVTPHRFFLNMVMYVNDLFYTGVFHNSRGVLIAWGLLIVLCAIARKKELWWAAFVISTAMLPVAFTIQARTGASLYVPLFGFALAASVVAAGFFPRRELAWAAVAIVAAYWGYQTVQLWQERIHFFVGDHRMTWSAITQVRELPAKPRPHNRVLFLNNPFEDRWDMWFISSLLWNDHTIDVKLANHMTPPPGAAEIDQFDWVLTFEGDRLRVIRSRYGLFVAHRRGAGGYLSPRVP